MRQPFAGLFAQHLTELGWKPIQDRANGPTRWIPPGGNRRERRAGKSFKTNDAIAHVIASFKK